MHSTVYFGGMIGLTVFLLASTGAALKTLHLPTSHTIDASAELEEPHVQTNGAEGMWASGWDANHTAKLYIGKSTASGSDKVCAPDVDQLTIVEAQGTNLSSRQFCGLSNLSVWWPMQWIRYLPQSDTIVVCWAAYDNPIFGDMDGAVAVYAASTGALRWSHVGGMVPLAAVDDVVIMATTLGTWIGALEVSAPNARSVRWNTTAPPGVVVGIDASTSTGQGMVVLLGNFMNTSNPLLRKMSTEKKKKNMMQSLRVNNDEISPTTSTSTHHTSQGGVLNMPGTLFPGILAVYQFSLNTTNGNLMCAFSASNYYAPLEAAGLLGYRTPLDNFVSFNDELWDMSPRCQVVATANMKVASSSLVRVGDSWIHISLENGTVTRFQWDGEVQWIGSLHTKITIRRDPVSVEKLFAVETTKHLEIFADFILFTLNKTSGELLEQAADLGHWKGNNNLSNILPYAPVSPTGRCPFRTLGHSPCNVSVIGSGSATPQMCSVFFLENLQGFAAFVKQPLGAGHHGEQTFHLQPLGWNVHHPLVVLDDCGVNCLLLLETETGAVTTTIIEGW